LSIHIYMSVLIFSLLYLVNTVGILFLCLQSMTSPGSRSLIGFSCFKDTPCIWSKPPLYSFSENYSFLPGLSPVSLFHRGKLYLFVHRNSVSWPMTSPETPEEHMLFPALQPVTQGISMKKYFHVLCNDAK